MSQPRTWPSQRLQAAVIIILAAAALLQAFMPPLTRDGRAEKLYEESWYVGLSFTGLEAPDREERSVRMLKKAIELEPGNSLYEQALVWQYPKEKLPELLKQESLGKKARILASGLIYRNQVNKDREITRSFRMQDRRQVLPGNPGYSMLFPPEYWEERLRDVNNLIDADPDNAVPRYLRALVYSDMERPLDMLSEVRAANRMNRISIYVPEIPDKLLNLGASASIFSGFLVHARELAQRIDTYGSRQLRFGNVESAIDTFEECCLMGVRISDAEPADASIYYTSSAIFTIGWKSLEPVYKDLGSVAKLRQYQEIKDKFAGDGANIRKIIDSRYTEVKHSFLIIAAIIESAIYVSICALIALALWGITVFITRRKNQEILNLPAWNEGWLAKFFVLAYIPFAVVTGLIINPVIIPKILAAIFGPGFENGILEIIISAVVVLQLAVFMTVLTVLRRRYIEHTGKRIGFWEFIFLVPSSAHAWRARSFTMLFAGQLVFLICCALAFIILSRPLYGVHPWQFWRMQYTKESEIVDSTRRYADELQKLIVVKSLNSGDNNRSMLSKKEK